MMTTKTKADPNVAALRKLFDDVQRENLRKGARSMQPTKENPARRTMKRRITKAWAASEIENRARVAACPKCRRWFPDTAERNIHRAAFATSDCRKAV